MKKLILTEKPSVARDFAQTLNVGRSSGDGYLENDQYVITWAIGHLLAPYDPEDYDPSLKKWKLDSLPIFPDQFRYKAQSQTKKQLEIVKKLLKRSDVNEVIVATDAGREGELIARLILEEAKVKKKSFRFWTSAALTKEVITKELNNLKPLSHYDRLYIAGSARQKADWLVGMNLSRLATLKLNDLFSVGRVQTAVLSLLVEKRKEIDNFKPSDYFELKTKFEFEAGSVVAYWFDPKKKEDDKRVDKKETLDLLAKKILNQKGHISLLNVEEKTLYPQGLYSLTELQRQANTQFGYSATRTLEIAQNLYEKYKCLSYPRTDSKVMAASSFDLVKSIVYKFKEVRPEYFTKFEEFKVNLKNKTVFDDSRLTDHHGLIPLKDFGGDRNSPEGKIFDLVLRRFLTNFMSNHKYYETHLEIECMGENFKTRGKKIIEMGFKELEGRMTEELLPAVELKDQGECIKLEVESKKTKPPFEYTESSLLYDMTNPARLVDDKDLKKIFRTEIGLGTQATRAQIIETLLKRGYVDRNAKNLIATSKGVMLVDKLSLMPNTKDLTSVSQTANLELKLQSMADGETDDKNFLDDIHSFISRATNEWKAIETAPRDPDKIESYGGKTFVKKTTTVSASFGACPLCKAEIMDFPKSYSCSKWKEGCGFTIWKMVAKKKISDSQVKKIITSSRSDLIKGFKSKAGKSFDAYLVMNKEGKVEFEFNN